MDYLKNYITKERTYGKKRQPATKEQLDKFGTITENILNGELGERKWYSAGQSSFNGQWHYPVVKELYAVVSEVTGKKVNPNLLIDGQVESFNRSLKELEKANNNTTRQVNTNTDFVKTAQTLDKSRSTPYWSSPHELMARAFESFFEAKVIQNGARQSLVYV